jgi:hypothetical protein
MGLVADANSTQSRQHWRANTLDGLSGFAKALEPEVSVGLADVRELTPQQLV